MAQLRVFLIFCFIFAFVNGQIPFIGKHPPTEFKILTINSIELGNVYRPTGKVKFTLNGVNITKVSDAQNNSWHIELNDGHNIEYTIQPTNHRYNLTRYVFKWNNTNGHGHQHEVCFDFSFNNAFWYSTFLEHNQPFPMRNMSKIEKPVPILIGSKPTSPFGSVIGNNFFNTDGFALYIRPFMPVFLRRDSNQICISINGHEHPYRYYTDAVSNRIFFSFVTASDIKQAFNATTNGLYLLERPQHGVPDEKMFSMPIWNLKSQLKSNETLTQNKVLEFGHAIKSHFGPAQLIIDDQWEAHYGDLTFDHKKFPDPKKMITELHHLGHKVKLLVHSFVSEESTFKKSHETFLLKENSTGKSLKITWNGNTGYIFDYSDAYKFRKFLVDQLHHLSKTIGIDSYRLDGGEVDLFASSNFQFSKTGKFYERCPNLITGVYGVTAFLMGKMVEVEAAFMTQEFSTFTRMKDAESSWDGLRSMVKTALTMSIAGYSFIIPASFKTQPKPTEELFIRWLQFCTFLPSMQFSIPPWSYSEKTVNLTKKFLALHHQHVPTIIKLSKEDLVKHSEPLIRPIWYLAPDDANTYLIADQFAVGNDIIVAPVLTANQTEKNVYLPNGVWIDQHGKSFTGPGQFKVLTPLEELAYFKRKH